MVIFSKTPLAVLIFAIFAILQVIASDYEPLQPVSVRNPLHVAVDPGVKHAFENGFCIGSAICAEGTFNTRWDDITDEKREFFKKVMRRNFEKLIFDIAQEKKWRFQWSQKGFLLCVTPESGNRQLYTLYRTPLNSASVDRVCDDKPSSYDVLRASNVHAVEHFLFLAQTRGAYPADGGGKLSVFVDNHPLLKTQPSFVLKPKDGTGGENVFRVERKFLDEDYARLFLGKDICICPFYDIADEYRVIVLRSEGSTNSLLTYRKIRQHLTGDGEKTAGQLFLEFMIDNVGFSLKDLDAASLSTIDMLLRNESIPPSGKRIFLNWKHNLGKGASAEAIEDGEEKQLVENLAVRAAEAIGVCVASIDIIRVGKEYRVIELNAGIMMESYAKKNWDIAKSVYRKILEAADARSRNLN